MMSIKEFNDLFDPRRFAAGLPTAAEAAESLKRFARSLSTIEDIDRALRAADRGNSVEHPP